MSHGHVVEHVHAVHPDCAGRGAMLSAAAGQWSGLAHPWQSPYVVLGVQCLCGTRTLYSACSAFAVLVRGRAPAAAVLVNGCLVRNAVSSLATNAVGTGRSAELSTATAATHEPPPSPLSALD